MKVGDSPTSQKEEGGTLRKRLLPGVGAFPISDTSKSVLNLCLTFSTRTPNSHPTFHPTFQLDFLTSIFKIFYGRKASNK